MSQEKIEVKKPLKKCDVKNSYKDVFETVRLFFKSLLTWPALASRHRISVPGPNGHRRYRTFKKCEEIYIRYNFNIKKNKLSITI